METMIICKDCSMMFMGIEEDKCEKCLRIQRLEMEQLLLLKKLDEMMETSKKWTMDFVNQPGEQSNYHYHLGQISAFSDIRNIMHILKN